MVYLHGYSDRQLDALAACAIYEVILRLESYRRRARGGGDSGDDDSGVLVLVDNSYGLTGTGDPFRVLGTVANGVLGWARRRRPDYLCWHFHFLDTKRSRLFDKIVRLFAEKRASGYRRLTHDPFTGAKLPAFLFWLERSVEDDATILP